MYIGGVKVIIPKKELEEYINEHPETTLKEIAKYFNLTQENITYFIKQYGIKKILDTKPDI